MNILMAGIIISLIVIAVSVYSCIAMSSKCSRIEEQEQFKELMRKEG